MAAWLEGEARRELEASVTIGRAATNDLVIGDASVSAVHATLAPYGAAWAVRDLGSRNGTWVNGERVWSERILRDGDELTIGTGRLRFRSDGRREATTSTLEPLPEVTRREHEVLTRLCAPLLAHGVFNPPATVAEIAAALFVSRSAVKKHLASLYGKFGIPPTDQRRAALAAAALHRGVVRTPP